MKLVRASMTIMILIATVAGCGREEMVEPHSPGIQVRLLTSDAVGELWGNQGESVLERLRVEFGAETTRIAAEDSESRRAALRACGEDEVDLVVCVGAAYEREVYSVAQHYPATAFVLSPGTVTAGNVAVLDFQAFGAAYLGGVVAAAEAGDRVGLVTGEGAPWLEVIGAGFSDGFRSRFPSGSIRHGVSADDVTQFLEDSVELAMYAADRLDPALVDAARAAGIRLIGIGRHTIHEYPETVVAALSVDLPEAIERIFRDVLDGTFRGRVYAFDLGSGVVDLTISPDLQAGWNDDELERVTEARAAVNAGLVELERMGL